MSNNVDATPAQLRGSLPFEQIGARGILKATFNPECLRLQTLTTLGISTATAADKIYGEPNPEKASPFALAIGTKFESTVFANEAERFINLYREANYLTSSNIQVIDIAKQFPGHSPEMMQQREELTKQLFRQKLARDPNAPNIIIKPRVAIRILGQKTYVEPDVLVAADNEPFYQVAEIKSYPDRAGKTDPAHLKSTRLQAAVGVVAISQTLKTLGVSSPGTIIPWEAAIILRKPSTNFPTLSTENISSEVTAIARVITNANPTLQQVLQILANTASKTIDNPTSLTAIPNNYLPDCRDHCALAKICRRQARSNNSLVLLGKNASEEFAAAGSLARVFQLLRGATARTPEEAALQQELINGLRLYQEVLGYVA